MQDFEKMGVFYLGKEYDIQAKEHTEDLVLYQSKDLTTHGVIIGMTGSGKTGLGIGLLEEAAMDNIPVIAIDPKGDLGNLKLTFPGLSDEEFKPWINAREAENKGLSVDEYAGVQAENWRKGLADWGQDGKRIEILKQNVDVNIYTPGNSSGIPVSALRSFAPPSPEVLEDADALANQIQITTTSLLSLVGVSTDSLTSREHVLIANILSYYWHLGQTLSLEELIISIQNPPIDKIGVMAVESFYPEKDRFALAMQFNNLLASPSFKSWLEGEPLDVKNFLYTNEGKPKVSIFSIAHLEDSERMFFVTMLLNEMISWMRSQPGTSSLRAILYMDEIFGYLPPTANPPSKAPLLTLLKQARAYGLGLLLATQNPVDLDYKALSNAGTWFIGRLQTERDKDRVLAGLEGVAAGGYFDKKQTEQILAGLGQRVFYLHNVHQEEPILFNTRWTMSYLAGPLTRKQIEQLTPSATEVTAEKVAEVEEQESSTVIEKEPVVEQSEEEVSQLSAPQIPPVVPSKVNQVYLPVEGNSNAVTYQPSVIGVVEVFYDSKKYKIATSKHYSYITSINDGAIPVAWSNEDIVAVELDEMDNEPLAGASFGVLPEVATDEKNYDKWKKLLTQHVRKEQPLQIWKSPLLKVYSEADEDERDFRIRIQHLAHEKRDEEIEKLQKKYDSKIRTLENRHQKARQRVETKSAQATQKKVDAAVSMGTAVIGALFGRKIASASNVSKMGTALRRTNRAMQGDDSIAQAEETMRTVELELERLELELAEEIEKITASYNLEGEELEPIEIRPTANNITLHYMGLAWNPNN